MGGAPSLLTGSRTRPGSAEGTNNPTQLAGVQDSLSHLSVQQPPQPQLTYAPAAPAAPPAYAPAQPAYAPAPAPAPVYQQNVVPGPFDAPPAPAGWVVTPTDKARYDQVLPTLEPHL